MKRLSRVLVIALVVVVALVGYNITFPAEKSATSNWTFVLTHPTLLLHVIVATGTGWYLGHRRERREEAAPLPGR